MNIFGTVGSRELHSIANLTILFTHEDAINPRGCRNYSRKFVSGDAKYFEGGCQLFGVQNFL